MEQDTPAALPIPPLEQTILRYLERIQPLLPSDKFLSCKKTAEKFLKNSGPLLHRELVDYGASLEGSWLKPIWDESYLSFRDPLNGNMNYSTVLNTQQIPQGGSIAEFFARLVAAMVAFHRHIACGEFEKEKTPSGFLCMEQYINVFGACRIPLPGKDSLFVSGALPDEHVVALYRGNMYLLPVVNDGKILSASSIARGIGEILGRNDAPAPNIGIMTAATRET
ncbi:MAG: choline/carnitine O-acyltransferase, partial [Treponema sp.]|nr:choline/carnitine O-acyltransferase [Treponema sp.]